MTRCHTTTLPHRTDASHVSAAWRAVRQRMEGGASHQAWVIVVAPGEPILYCQQQLFCFVAFRLPRADQTGREVQSGKLACMDEHHRLAARA